MDKTKKNTRMTYSDGFMNDIKTSPQIDRIRQFVENYDAKGKHVALMERARLRQNIANAKSEYDRIEGELSKGQGLAGDAIQMLQARERELSALIRKSLRPKYFL
jgi:hypothetical protein